MTREPALPAAAAAGRASVARSASVARRRRGAIAPSIVGLAAFGLTTAACSSPAPAAPTAADSAPAEAPTDAAAAASGAASEAATPAPAAGSGYRDGEYTAEGWYGSLPSHQDVTLTIRGDVVTAVEITTPAEDETSLGYQQRFADALPEAIVGRSIDELAIDRLAGSSGCSEGFMSALALIKAEAAA